MLGRELRLLAPAGRPRCGVCALVRAMGTFFPDPAWCVRNVSALARGCWARGQRPQRLCRDVRVPSLPFPSLPTYLQPWWDDELRKAWRTMSEAWSDLRELRRMGCSEAEAAAAFQTYKQARDVKKRLHRVKRTSWQTARTAELNQAVDRAAGEGDRYLGTKQLREEVRRFTHQKVGQRMTCIRGPDATLHHTDVVWLLLSGLTMQLWVTLLTTSHTLNLRMKRLFTSLSRHRWLAMPLPPLPMLELVLQRSTHPSINRRWNTR